jgi:hypothetical protein
MARWKLMTAHYLNVPGEEWEYIETDRKTGRPRRTKFPVPRLLDVNDPTCWTNRWGGKDNEDGEIIVCHDGKGEPSDQIFFGDPTPDMMPIDDEAKAISASFEDFWRYKPEEGLGNHSQSLIDKFQIELAEAQAKPVEIPGLTDLVSVIAKQTEMFGKLIEGRRI